MTSGEIGVFLIIGAVVLSLFKRKKPSNVVFVEMFEWVEVRQKAKLPRSLVNLAFVAGVVLFIWMMAGR
jgi:hypothetical protein